MRLGSHVQVRGQRSEIVFREVCGDEAADRWRAKFEALPSKAWRGPKGDREPVTVYRVWCIGGFGKKKDGHEVFLPERVIWQLLSFDRFICPHHQGIR
jgi:hypothetical protein